MNHDKKGWYHNASRLFAILCALAAMLFVLGVIFCVQDYLEAKAAGEAYDLLGILVQGAVVCGLPALIAGFLAVRFRDKGM